MNEEAQKYKGVPKKIAEEIQEYENKYFREDKPIPFCGLLIYPATVHDYESFSHCSSCLTLNKNQTVEGIKMSHLDYLISQTQIQGEEGRIWSYKIQKLLEIIFKIDNGIKCSKCGRVIRYDSQEFSDYVDELQKAQDENKPFPPLKCPDCDSEQFQEVIKIVLDPETKKYSLLVDGHIINSKDFNRLRYIVLFQNFPDYRDDTWVDPDVKKDYEERMRLEYQKNDIHASIEKKVVCLSIATHYSFAECFDMSIRKFTMALSTVDDLINYKIMKAAISSGFTSLPKGEKIEHWIYKPYKDMYGDAYKSLDQAQSEVQNL